MSDQRPNPGGADRHSHTVKSDLVRPRYSPGLILEDSDLTAAVDYTRELNRMLFRTLFGCGVLSGLRVSVERDQSELIVLVEPGLALDGRGDPIHLVSPARIRLDWREGVLPEAGGTDPKRRNFWVVLRGDEERCGLRELVSDGDDLDVLTQPTRLRTLARVSAVFERPNDACQCDPAGPGLEGKELDDHYDALATNRSAEGHDCHKQLDRSVDRPTEGTISVLLARLHWPKSGSEWKAIHRGERRFVGPTFGPDPIDDAPAAAAVPETAAETAPASTGKKKTGK